MNLSFRIALRYVYSRKSFNFITIITLISFIGISAGVAALICVMSIFNGFRNIAESQMVGFDPHIRLVSKNNPFIFNADSLIDNINNLNSIESVMPILQGRVIAINGSNIQVFLLNGVKNEDVKSLSGISNSVAFGSFDISAHGLPGIVVGAALADRLRVLPYDTLYLLSPAMLETSIRTFRGSGGTPFIVTGIFQTNVKDYDIMHGFAAYRQSMPLFKTVESYASSVDIRLSALKNVEYVKNEIINRIPSDILALTWIDLNKELYKIMRFERMAAFVILSLIIVIAVFNILASLSMTVVEKRRDIAAMKAMGADNKMIRNIFTIEGLLVGTAGSLVGSALGLGLCFGQIHFKWFKIDTAKYIIDAIPVSIELIDTLIVFIVAVVLSFLATIYPSKRASETIIIQAIREE